MRDRFSLSANSDGTYDLILEYDRLEDAEFALDVLSGEGEAEQTRSLRQYLKDHAENLRIKTVKVVLSGVLIATIPFGMLFSAGAADAKYAMAYLYGGTVAQQIEQVKKANGSLQTVSPSYFDINSSGELVLNNVSSELVASMHEMGVRVVPMLSNHWDRTGGQLALQDPQGLAQQLAGYVESYDLDGINVDIENVTEKERDAYTQLVAALRDLIPQEKEVSVAVAANPNGWNVGWHGSYDYAALGEHADYLMIMAYDESWQGGDAGPVASAGFVENSIKYALQFVPAEKLVVGVPFYGRIWSEDAAFNGNGISLAALQSVIEDYNADVTYDETYQSPVARFTVREGDVSHSVNGKTLTPGNYTIWFEDEQSLEAKVRLIHDYDLKGMGSWALNQATDSILGNLGNWLNAAEENTAVGYVTASSLRVREAPNTDSNIIAYYSEGDTVTLIGEEENGWYKLRLSDGKNGYVSALYISLTPPVAVRTGYVTADRLNVRQSASTSGTVLTVITEGTALTVLGGEQDGWYRVELADSTAGYVSAQYIAFTAPAVRKTGYAAALANVRQSANSGGTILTTVAPGTQFTVVGDAVDGWYRVELANGTAGFILADNVTFTKPAADRTGYVTASVLNVRKSASTSSSILTTVTNGTALTVHGEAANGWYQVTLSNGTAGYVSAQYIAFTAPNPAKTGYVTASVLNVRKSASTSSAIVTTLARNTAVTITGSLSNNFYPVRLANGTTGYVSADYITFTNPAGSAKTGTVTASTLNIRKSASTSSTIVTTVKKGASLTVTGSAVSGFYPVRLANGTTGYASTQYVTVK